VAINEVVRILTTSLQKVEKATGETKDWFIWMVRKFASRNGDWAAEPWRICNRSS